MIDLTNEQKSLIVTALRSFMSETLDVELGTFESEDLLDFVNQSIGPLYYNRGLLDAQTQLSLRVEGLIDAISELEKPSPFGR